VPLALKWLRKPDTPPEVTARARELLARADQARGVLRDRSSSSSLKRSALRALGAIGTRRDLLLVRRELRSEDPEVVVDAIAHLGRRIAAMKEDGRTPRQEWVSNLEAIAAAMRAPSATAAVRLAGIEVLKQPPMKISAESIAASLSYPDVEVRCAAGAALAGARNLRYLGAVLEAVKDGSTRYKESILAGFLEVDSRSTDALRSRRLTVLANALLNEVKKNPLLLRAVPYAYADRLATMRYTARTDEVRQMADGLYHELRMWESSSWRGKFDPSPLLSRDLPSTWYDHPLKWYGKELVGSGPGLGSGR
jgi:HEAT repeat protein